MQLNGPLGQGQGQEEARFEWLVFNREGLVRQTSLIPDDDGHVLS